MTHIQHATGLTVLWPQNSFLFCCWFRNERSRLFVYGYDSVNLVLIFRHWLGHLWRVREAAARHCREKFICSWSCTRVHLLTQKVLSEASAWVKGMRFPSNSGKTFSAWDLFLSSSVWRWPPLLGFLWGWKVAGISLHAQTTLSVGLPSSRGWIECWNRKEHLL